MKPFIKNLYNIALLINLLLIINLLGIQPIFKFHVHCDLAYGLVTLSKYFLLSFSSREIPWKNVIAFASDNCSVMKGRHNSVLSRIKKVQPNVLDIGCICHLANLCCVHGVKQLPLPVEELLIDVFFHFNHSAKRKEIYREFLEFCDVAPLKILKHATTRWLSLQRCVKRFLQQWPALLSYFRSHEDCDHPGRVKRCADYLASLEMKAYFMFLAFILEPLNQFNTIFQTDATQIAILLPEMNRLLRVFMAKFVTMRVIKSAEDLTTVPFADRSQQLDNSILAVGMELRSMLANDEDDLEEATVTRVFDSVRKFYVAVVTKMINIFPFHDDVLRDLAALNPDPALRESWSAPSVLDLAVRFGLVADEDHHALVAEFQDYQLSPEDELPVYTAHSRVDTFWAEMGKKKTFAGGVRFPHLARVMTTMSVIAHSNADSERVFSMCRKIDTDARSQLGNDTLRALLSCKINTDEPCYEFRPDSDLLKSAKSATWNYVKDHQ